MNKLKVIPVSSPYAKQVEASALRSFGPRGNLTGMRKNFGWDNSHPVKVGQFVYDVPADLYKIL